MFNYLLFIPLDYPIIFNRKTGKVYVYEYVFSIYGNTPGLIAMIKHPFFLITRPQQKIVNWHDVQGVEAKIATWFHQTKMSRSLIFGVVKNKAKLSHCQIFRIITLHEEYTEEHLQLWAWICNYMSYKDERLDTTVVKKKRYWGRKIGWSEAIKRELYPYGT